MRMQRDINDVVFLQLMQQIAQAAWLSITCSLRTFGLDFQDHVEGVSGPLARNGASQRVTSQNISIKTKKPLSNQPVCFQHRCSKERKNVAHKSHRLDFFFSSACHHSFGDPMLPELATPPCCMFSMERYPSLMGTF